MADWNWKTGIFGNDDKAKVKQYPQQPWQKQGTGFLSGLLNRPAPLQGVAGMSPMEQQGQGLLGSILSGGTFADPRTSGLYRGLRDESRAEEQQGVEALRRRSQMAGMFNSSPALGAEADYRADMGNRRMSLLGSLYDQERTRDNPYTRLQAAGQYGSLARLLQQAQMNSMYQQQMAPWTTQAPIAQGLMARQPTTYMQPPQQSVLSQMLQAAGALAPLLGGM